MTVRVRVKVENTGEVKVMVRVRRIICVPKHCILAVLLMGHIILIN